MKLFNKDAVGYKMYFIMVVFLLAFLRVILRAYQLQVIDSEFLKKKAQRDFAKTRVSLSKRGTIFDRNGNPLAISVRVMSIYARPSLIEDKKKTARVLARITGQSWRSIYRDLCKKSRLSG